MKDRTVRGALQRPPRRSNRGLRLRPFASPEPELEGVADELRQLYELYADDDEVPDRLADLAREAADAYEQLAASGADSGEPLAEIVPVPSGTRH